METSRPHRRCINDNDVLLLLAKIQCLANERLDASPQPSGPCFVRSARALSVSSQTEKRHTPSWVARGHHAGQQADEGAAARARERVAYDVSRGDGAR